MGILSMIAKRKESFHKTREAVAQFKTDVAIGKIERQQQANLREAKLTQAKQELREAQQINADLRADQMQQVQGQQPSKLKNLGKGMAAHMKKQKPKGGGMRLGAVQSTGSRGLNTSGQGSPFGGQRNLDVGGKGLQIGGGSGGFSFGPSEKKMPEKRKGTTITIKTQ